MGLNTICKRFPTVPCPRETTDARWAQRSEVRSTAGQHLRHNKAAAVECWQQEVDDKKTLFWILWRAVTQGRYLVSFRCQEFPKHLHWWDTLLEQQLQREAALGCLKWQPATIFWPMNTTPGLGSDGNPICSPNSRITHTQPMLILRNSLRAVQLQGYLGQPYEPGSASALQAEE